MHELGIITNVLDAVQQRAVEVGAASVLKIDLRIGEMVEAIEDSLIFSFEALRELPEYEFCRDAELGIEYVSPRSRCSDCNKEFDHDRFHMRCPYCQGGDTQLVAGREMEISSIEVDFPDGDGV